MEMSYASKNIHKIYFQPKIGRKIRIFRLGREKQYSDRKKKECIADICRKAHEIGHFRYIKIQLDSIKAQRTQTKES